MYMPLQNAEDLQLQRMAVAKNGGLYGSLLSFKDWSLYSKSAQLLLTQLRLRIFLLFIVFPGPRTPLIQSGLNLRHRIYRIECSK